MCIRDRGNDSSVAAEAEEGNDSNVAAEAEEGSAPVELVYWNQWTQEDEIAFLEKYIEEYNNSQDKYHVSFLAIPFEEYTTTKLATAFATNEAPDIFECSPAIINQYLDAGVCEPLDDIITDGFQKEYEISLEVLSLEEGKQLALFASNENIYENGDLTYQNEEVKDVYKRQFPGRCDFFYLAV